MRVIAFRKGTTNPLLLTHIVWDGNRIDSAYVENGCWEMTSVDGVLCVEGDKESPIDEIVDAVFVPEDIVGDYNDIIEWAINEVKRK